MLLSHMTMNYGSINLSSRKKLLSKIRSYHLNLARVFAALLMIVESLFLAVQKEYRQLKQDETKPS